MSNTLLSYRTDVRADLDDSEYDADIIDRGVNDYINEIATKSKLRKLEASDELFISAGDTDVEFPDDKNVLINLSVTNPTPARRIMQNYMEYNQFIVDNAGYASVAARSVVNVDWTDFGDVMRLGAPASVNTTVFVEYMRVPTKLENDDDENELDPNDVYHEMFVIGSRVRAMEINEDYDEAAEERKKLMGRVVNGVYRPGLEETFIKNEGRGRIKIGPTVMGTRRGRRSGYRADRDF